MPLAIFFVTLLISVSLTLSTMGVVKRAQTSQASLAYDSAYLTSQSVLDQAWADAQPDESAQMISGLDQTLFNSVLDLTYNQGIESSLEDFVRSSVDRDPFIELFERSAEVSLRNVSPDEMSAGISIDVCRVSETCPEVILEWFRFDRHFRFQDLSLLDKSSFDENLSDGCVDLPAVGVQRCVLRSSGRFFPSIIQRLDADDEYSQRWRFRTSMASYDYILRVWIQSAEPVWIRFSGLDSFPDGAQLSLPQQVYQSTAVSKAEFSQVQSQESHRISAGLQDGLGFVHYADEVEGK
jgi:hypothetical protein